MKKKRSGEVNKKKELSVKQYIIQNIIVIFLFASIFLAMYFFIPAYNRLVKIKIYKNTKYIFDNKDLTEEQKYGARMKKDYAFLKFIKDRTDEDAVILFPPTEVFEDTPFNQDGAWGIKNPNWVTYFLYPRIIINEDWKDKYPEVYDKYTNVFVVNGWGFDKVDYPVPSGAKYMLLPRDRDDLK